MGGKGVHLMCAVAAGGLAMTASIYATNYVRLNEAKFAIRHFAAGWMLFYFV